MDFRVGGNERMRFRGENGMVFTNHTIYRDIVPERRIVFSYTMSMGDKCFSSSQATIELLATGRERTLSLPSRRHFLKERTARKCAKRDGVCCSTNWRAERWRADAQPTRPESIAYFMRWAIPLAGRWSRG